MAKKGEKKDKDSSAQERKELGTAIEQMTDEEYKQMVNDVRTRKTHTDAPTPPSNTHPDIGTAMIPRMATYIGTMLNELEKMRQLREEDKDKTFVAEVGEDGRITIPIALRKLQDITVGSIVSMHMELRADKFDLRLRELKQTKRVEQTAERTEENFKSS